MYVCLFLYKYIYMYIYMYIYIYTPAYICILTFYRVFFLAYTWLQECQALHPQLIMMELIILLVLVELVELLYLLLGIDPR